MLNRLQRSLFLVVCIVVGIAPGALAEGKPISRAQPQQVIRDIPSLTEVEQPLTTAEGLLVQQPAPTPAQVTGVQLKPTEKGLEVVLETAGEFPEVLTSETENRLITDIPNAQLRLPKGGAFRQDNPTQAIAFVEVINLDAKTIRVTVTGKAGVPTAKVSQSPQALILSVAAPPAPAPSAPPTPPPAPAAPVPGQQAPPPAAPAPEAKEEAPVELTLTAEEEAGGYNVPDTTTATLTDTPIRDIPQSIQVVPQEVIEDRNVTELEDALETVAGVISSGGRGSTIIGPFIQIRGFDYSSIFRDGIPYLSAAPLSTNDLERVEVLKGPASVLFGQSEPGGIINLISKKPLDEPFYSASFTAGSFDTYQGDLDASGPLNESKTVKYRLNVSYENYGSFRDFVNGESLLISPTLTWEIGPNTSINFYGRYTSDEETIDDGIPAFGDGIVDVPRDRFLNEPWGKFEQDQFNIGYTFNHQFSEDWSVRQALRYTQYEPVRYYPWLDSFDEETGELSRVEFYADGTYKEFFTNADVVGRFSTGPIQHQLLFGAEYKHNAQTPRFQSTNPYTSINVFDPIYTRVPFEIAPDFFEDDNVDTIGVYLQDQIDLLPNLKVLAGVRYDYTDQFVTTQNLGEPRQEFPQTDSAFSPRFGIVYQPIQPLSVYASYTTSFAPSYAGTLNPDDSTFDPETGRQFEVGVKADLLDQLSLTFAAFDIRKQNVSTPDTENPLFSVQTGAVASRGIELNLDGEILPGWNITAAYAYLDAFVSQDNTDIVGNKLANVPNNQISLWSTYEIQQGNLQGLGVGLGLFYVGDRQGDLDNTFVLPSYFRTDASLFYKRNNWRVQLNIENLFNVEYFSSASYGSRLEVNPGAPFNVKGEVSIEF